MRCDKTEGDRGKGELYDMKPFMVIVNNYIMVLLTPALSA